MRLPLPIARVHGEAWKASLKSVRLELRTRSADNNPFARPLPCPLGDLTRTARIFNLF